MASDLLTILTILGMGVVTYATRVSGIWVVKRMEVSDQFEEALEAIPGAVLISLIVPELVSGGVPEWGAALAVLAVAVRTGNIVLAMIVGIGVVWLLRTIPGTLI